MAFKVNPEKKILVVLEKLFLQHSGFETTVIRFSGLIGRDRNPGKFFKEGRVVKNGMAPINLIHLDDCILIIQKICMTTFNGEIFNAAADTHPTKKDFYTAASNANKLVPATFLSNEDYNYKIISNEKKYTILHTIFDENNITVLFGDDANYFETFDMWFNQW